MAFCCNLSMQNNIPLPMCHILFEYKKGKWDTQSLSHTVDRKVTIKLYFLANIVLPHRATPVGEFIYFTYLFT